MLDFLATPSARLLAGALFLLLAIGYYSRFLRRQNWRLIALVLLLVFSSEHFFNGFIYLANLLAVLILLRSLSQRSNDHFAYVPSLARIEGGGIKRGLTPPEAAIVMGKPLHLVITLLLFEMLRKGFIEQIDSTPLKIALSPAFQTIGKNLSASDKKNLRRLAAQAIPASLHIYEEAFLEILEINAGMPVNKIDYEIAVQPLIRFTASRVGGHDLKETKEYYRLLVDRAPKEARTDGVLTTDRQKVFDRNFALLLVHEDFESILDQNDYSYQPVWWRKKDFDLPDVSFAVWAENLMNKMEKNFSQNIVDLELGDEEDMLTATLMNEIARATYYG